MRFTGILNCGVLHGSILEMIFLLYANTIDIPQLMSETVFFCALIAFVQIYKNLWMIESTLNKEISSICCLFIENKFSIC